MFLRKALQSVADQTFQNYEAIIVDDGSTDRCPEIIAKYVRKYSNFKSVRQENAGLSAARNTGLRLAQGSYRFYGQRRLLSAHLSGGHV